ncbi:MAG: bifunctional serine/threonine-protein kinase/ABC transporter substrate-binding protein [Polyangiaceae bacterium]
MSDDPTTGDAPSPGEDPSPSFGADGRAGTDARAFEEHLAATLQGQEGEDSTDFDVKPVRVVEERYVREGDVLAGRYKVVRVLARGGIGFVVRAFDAKLDRTVAIKFLLPHYAKATRARSRFELEAKVAAKIDSEHVPRIIDVGELDPAPGQPPGLHGGEQYIVMEHLTGEDLSRVLQLRGRLPLGEAIELVLQICRVLALAHAAGIVHRDLKPGNVFLTHRTDGSPCVKVLDFGVAKFKGHAEAAPPAVGPRAGAIVGTPRYMAPEQIEANHADERSDIWAVGTILFELLTGSAAFGGHGVDELFQKIQSSDASEIASRLPEDARPCASIIERCLARDPADRYGNAADLARALSRLEVAPASRHVEHASRALGEGSVEAISRFGGTSAPSVVDTPPARPRRARFALAALAAALTATTVATLWWAMRAKGQDESRAGRACNVDANCGSLSCLDGMCTKRCERSTDCPAGTKCGEGVCAKPLKVGFLYVGVPEDEGWTGTHDRGRRDVTARLPWLETDFVSDVYLPGVAERAIDAFVARGFDVIVANSSSLRDAVVERAAAHPGTTFLVYSEAPNSEVGAFGGRLEQAWYLAGFAAAQRSSSHRLGFVGPLATPEIVRYINAFTLGARRFDAKIAVEVRWIGFWFDTEAADARGTHKEERLTDELLATGCDVVAHNADNGRVVDAVAAWNAAHPERKALSIANNNPAGCDRAKESCLGAVAWNWGPLYASIFDDIHRGTWTPVDVFHPSIKSNPEQSTVNFVINPVAAGAEMSLEVAPVLAELANDQTGLRLFDGPYCSTGQRSACVPAATSITEDELRPMCWFVEGVVEKETPGDPRSVDRPARVPEECRRNP